jgi:hypothetical protein
MLKLTPMMKCHHLHVLVFAVIFSGALAAKNEPVIVMTWPADKPALKLTFEKFRQMSVYAGQSTFISDVRCRI